MVIHLIDYSEDRKVPNWDKAKKEGYSLSVCGYQRLNTTSYKEKVTCKLCLRNFSH